MLSDQTKIPSTSTNAHMKPLTLFFLIVISLVLILSCSDKMITEIGNYNFREEPNDTNYTTVDTRGYTENDEIITRFDCPDSRFFLPIDIKLWDKIEVVNGRLPTYKETLNGKSIHTYAGKRSPAVKPYNITLPKLAYYAHGPKKMVLDSNTRQIKELPEVVVVVQVVQTAYDTIVGYRYLTGGVGGSLFRDFHFLTDEEVKKVVTQ